MKVVPSVRVIVAAVVGSRAAAHALVVDPDFDQAQNQLHPIPQPLKRTAGGLLEPMVIAMVAPPRPIGCPKMPDI